MPGTFLEYCGDGVFVFGCSFEQKHIPKQAGFLWHGGKCMKGCKACAKNLGKVWWTTRQESAARLIEWASPEAKRALETHLQRLEESMALDSTYDVPTPDGLDFRPYQKAGIKYAINTFNQNRGCYLADEMGLGKTPQALGVINKIPEQINSVLVICPASLRINWHREALRWLTKKFNYFICETGKDLPPGDSNFVICTYDLLAKDRNNDFVKYFLQRKWDYLICDETHKLKNPQAKRTKTIIGKKRTPGVIYNSKYKIFLSGTPYPNGRPVEGYHLFEALYPGHWGGYFPFAKRYTLAHHNGFGWDFSRENPQRSPELRQKLRASIMVRRLKADVLTDLPPKVRQIVNLPSDDYTKELEEEQNIYSYHRDTINEIKQKLEDAERRKNEDDYRKASQLLREAQGVAFAKMAKVRQKIALAKVPKVIEFIDDFLEDKKIILFAHHHSVIDKYKQHWGDKAVVLDGRTNINKRQEAVDRFQNDADVKVFIGQITAAGVGITLTAANYVAFAESSWVPSDVSQAEDRPHRIGQKDTVFVYHLVFDGSIDANMLQTIISKQDSIDRLLDRDGTISKKEPSGEIKSLTISKDKEGEEEVFENNNQAFTQQQRQAALQCMQQLAIMCDGAREQDGTGFSKTDTNFGTSLASMIVLTDRQMIYAIKLARKYKKQLPEDLLKILEISKEDFVRYKKPPKRSRQYKCSKCGQAGHNSRTCRGK